jgi:hypothetical protein
MIAGSTMTPIIPALRNAVVLIEEAARIEENRIVNGPISPLVYQKIQANTSLMNNSSEVNGLSDGSNESASHVVITKIFASYKRNLL